MKRPLCFVVLTTALIGSAPAAIAQEGDIAGPLTEGVSCSGSSARNDLELNIQKLEAANEAVGAALSRVAGDATRCAPVREAANELAAVYLVATPPDVQEPAALSAGSVVEQTLAEADRNAASLKFEVGPPPRNMTKARNMTKGRGVSSQYRP